MKTFHGRKLQLQPPYGDMSFYNLSSNSSPPHPSSSPLHSPYNNPNNTIPPFDSYMALTVLVLLIALFFMGFFSIYIRKFSSEPAPEFITSTTRNNQRRTESSSSSNSITKGLDSEIVKSLPVYFYGLEEAKCFSFKSEECSVCLGEFEEKESVKVIPFCKHLFHLECIDTWLKLHVTCPVCRGTKFFDEVGNGSGGGGDGGRRGGGDGQNQCHVCIEIGTMS